MTLSTGLSSLRAHQTALSVIGNNIANASTDGFRRQEAVFTENEHVVIGGLSIGTGVSISDIRSASNAAVESAILDIGSDGGRLTAQLDNAKQLDSLFIPGTGTLQERTEDMFLHLERLSGLPTDATLRSSVVHAADALSEELNRISQKLTDLTSSTEALVQETIDRITELSSEAAKLNAQVIKVTNEGGDSSAIESRRNTTLGELSKLIDIDVRKDGNGKDTYVMADGLFSITGGTESLVLKRNDAGILELWKEGCDEPHEVTGGTLGGLLSQNNDEGGIQSLRNKLDSFTSALVSTLDAAHATGVGIGGAFASLASGRPVQDTSAVLASQELVAPVQAGTLYISVNDVASDTVELQSIDFYPSTQSLDDLATLISDIPQLTARTTTAGKLSIVADPGFTFDFTGNLQTNPDTTALTGTTQPRVSGRYTGSVNDDYELRFAGSGTVGVTAGLQVEVTNRDGETVRVLDVGTNYEPSSNLLIGDGIQIAFSSGTVVDGESISLTAPAKPDETGVLAALGLNTLFVGKDAATLSVNTLIAEDPTKLATTTNGQPSDTRNLHRMLATRDSGALGDGTITLEQFVADIAADAGRELSDLEQDVIAFEEQEAFLQSQFDAAFGVDVNQELARMLQYQRAYQAAARYIATVDQTLQQLMTIIR